MCLFKQDHVFVGQTLDSMYNTVSVSFREISMPTTYTATTQEYSNQGKTLQAISHAKPTENTLLTPTPQAALQGHSCVYGMWYNDEIMCPARHMHTTASEPLGVWVALFRALLVNSLSPEVRKWVSSYLDSPDLGIFLPAVVTLRYHPL